MAELKHTKNMAINFCEKWPFRVELISDGKEIFSFDRRAHSTKQKTIEDCEQAVGFPKNEKDNVIALLENQKADIILFSCAPEMLEFLIEQSKESIEMWKDNCSGFYFEEWKAANIKKVNLIEKATGLKIEEILNNGKN